MALRDLITKRRLALASVALATIPFGLLANRYRWWDGNAGAFAYEVLFIAAAQTVFIRSRTIIIALIVFVATCGVELLQLYNAPWIVAVRDTFPGRLLLGANYGFDPWDMVRYLIGSAIGLAICFPFRERQAP
ncbi:MAG: DUF2809 domain-containing protein [Myxococcales bacterium]|nr:DUF2809 domain-containing protein [Myxococcales bacterium]